MAAEGVAAFAESLAVGVSAEAGAVAPGSSGEPALARDPSCFGDAGSSGSYLKFAELCGFGLVLMVLIALVFGMNLIAIVYRARLRRRA